MITNDRNIGRARLSYAHSKSCSSAKYARLARHLQRQGKTIAIARPHGKVRPLPLPDRPHGRIGRLSCVQAILVGGVLCVLLCPRHVAARERGFSRGLGSFVVCVVRDGPATMELQLVGPLR